MKKIFTLIVLILSIIIMNAQHLKKDGTPDMRYKENKETYSSTSSSSSTSSYSNSETHLKKDGTPDMRYKENHGAPSYVTTATATPKYESNTINFYAVKRNAKGKIERSQAAKYEFKKQSGYPNGRPGYVIDHIKPLKKGGCDCPENMQWQTIQAAKEKDRWE